MSEKAEKRRRREAEAQKLGITVEELRRRRTLEHHLRLERKASSAGLSVEEYLQSRNKRKEQTEKKEVSRAEPPTRQSGGGSVSSRTSRAAKSRPPSTRDRTTAAPIALRDAAMLMPLVQARKEAALAKKAAAKAKTNRKGSTLTSKGPPTKRCRECLKEMSPSRFPNPRVPRCEDCGGQAPSKSVRTVSGGAPGLGKRR